MNLVNGWQYTGMGPYYSKDSSSAQNILSGGISARLGGQAAKDVISSVADLAKSLPGGGTQAGGMLDMSDSRLVKLSESLKELPTQSEPMFIPDFAEIHVYEPSLGPDGVMTWSEITCCTFNRAYVGAKETNKEFAQPIANSTSGGGLQSGGVTGTMSDSIAQSAIASVFGVSPNSPAIRSVGGALQSGGEGGQPVAGGVSQVNVVYPDGETGCEPRSPGATCLISCT